MVRAAGAAAFAVDAFQHVDDILDFTAFAEAGQAFGVAVAAFDDFHLTNGIAFGLEVNLRGAGHSASGKGCAADAARDGICEFCYVVHFVYRLSRCYDFFQGFFFGDRLEPGAHFSIVWDILKEVILCPNPVPAVAIHGLVHYGVLLRRLDGGEGDEAVNFFVAEVTIVLVHELHD